MITSNHPSCSVIVITDIHGEYSLPQSPNVMTIFDGFAMEDLVGEEKTTDFIKSFPTELDLAGDYMFYLHQIKGTPEEILTILQDFCKTIFGQATGGDDDTYDYWPNALDMAKQIATDLDKLKLELHAYDWLRQQYNDFVKTYGEVPEHTFE